MSREDLRDLGDQPIDQMMEDWKLTNHDLVEVSTEQLTHKQVQKARNGRRLTLKMMQKVTRAFNVSIWHQLNDEQKEVYFEYMHKHLRSNFLQIILRAKKLLSPYYPKELKTVGDYLRAKRLRQNMSQPQLAKKLGVRAQALRSWELNTNTPAACCWPEILKFLGEDFSKKAETFSEKLLWWRRERGLKSQDAAKSIGLNPSAWSAWETERRLPTEKSLKKVQELTGINCAV